MAYIKSLNESNYTTLNKKNDSHSPLLKTVDGLIQTFLIAQPECGGKEMWNMYEMTQPYITKKNLIQLLKESGQRVYEHIHFLGGPVPKGIELIRQQGTVSRTPIPYGSKGWWGRTLLIPGDTVTGYHAYDKGLHIYDEIKDTIYHVLHGKISPIEPYLIHVTILYCFGSLIYYGVAKWGDSIQVTKQILKNTHGSDDPNQ